ncbi:unnamed protein product [Durusdinium trenchii]|uniref:Uncharacterized protein n=2 Tax=Durusdinium trenchii TaxID=1381693 RepID=A0ABP0PLR7_9DINO
MLRIRLLSGAIVAEFHPDELHRMSSEKPVRALKQYLAAQIGCSRFRQRLLREDIELEDDALLTLPSDLQLVILDFQGQDTWRQQNHAFISACEKGRVEEVEAMLHLPHDPNTRDHLSRDQAAIHVAAQGGHLEVVRLLLEAGANKDAASQVGFTALHLATYSGQLEVVRELLFVGAQKDAVALDGSTALHWACENGRVEVVRELLAAGADKHAATHRGLTPLKLAAVMGHLEVIQLLDAAR